MIFDDEKNEYVLASGRRFYAFGNILGVDRDGVLTYGHDGTVGRRDRVGGDDDPFTDGERREIADAMIARWCAFSRQGVRSSVEEAREAALHEAFKIVGAWVDKCQPNTVEHGVLMIVAAEISDAAKRTP